MIVLIVSILLALAVGVVIGMALALMSGDYPIGFWVATSLVVCAIFVKVGEVYG